MSAFTAHIVGSSQSKKFEMPAVMMMIIIIITFIESDMLDLIFFKVESSMQLWGEIYGYLFQHVKRTCMALSNPSVYAEICTFFERMEESYFCACTHFLN